MLPLLLTALVLQASTGAVPPAPPTPQVERATPRAPPPAPAAQPAPPPAPPPVPGLEQLRGDWSRPSGKRITIEDTSSIDDALSEIAQAADWNVVLNTGRIGNRLLVLRLRNVPVEDALRAAIAGTPLVATRTGDTVVVAEGAPPAVTPPPVLSGFEKPTGKRFTGDFEEEPVEDALRQIAEAAGLSIIIPPGEHGTITAQFRNVQVESALRAVLTQGGLVAERDGDLLTVREAGGGFPFLPPGLGRDARRIAEQAMREAEREVRRAEREAQGEAHPLDAARDRNVTGQDVVVTPQEPARDVHVMNGDVTLEGGASARDVSVLRGNLELQGGASARDVSVVFGKVTLAGGASAREVVAVGGDVEVGPGAAVEHDVTSIGGRVIVDPNADVGGDANALGLPSVSGAVGGLGGWLFGGESFLVRVLEALVKFVVLFVLGLIVLSAFPRRLEAVTGTMVASPVRSVLAGLVGSLAFLLLAFLLVVTIIGALLVPVLVVAILGGAVLGITALTYYVGRLFPLKDPRVTPVVQLAIGTAVYCAVTELPVVDIMATIAAWLITIGAVIRSRFGQHGPAALPTTVVPPVEGPA